MVDVQNKRVGANLIFDKSNWNLVKFDEVAFQKKSAVDRGDTTITKYIKGEHMGSEDLHVREWGELTDEYLGPAFIRKFEKGDVLYGSRRTYLRKVAVADFDGITSNTTFVINAKPKVLNPDLLPFIMLSEGFAQNSIKNSKGSVNPYINWKDIGGYEFLLPQIEQQAELAELLWACDEMIENNKVLKAKLETAKIAFFKTNFQCSEGDEIRFSDLLNINPTLPKNSLDSNVNVSFVTMADVTEDGYISAKETRRLADVKKAFTYFAEKDILFAKITPCMENGKGAIATDLTNLIGYGSTEFHVLRSILYSDLHFCFFLTQMPFFRKKAEQHMTGSAGQKRVPSDFFSTFKFKAPKAEKREEIGKITLELEKSLQQVKSQIKVLQQLRKSSINQIF